MGEPITQLNHQPQPLNVFEVEITKETILQGSVIIANPHDEKQALERRKQDAIRTKPTRA